MNLVELHDDAMTAAGATFRLIDESQWTSPTPDTEWDVRTLANHIVSENFWVAPLMEGQTVDDVGNRYGGDVLGADPMKTFDEAAHAAVTALHQPDAMDARVHLSFGTVPAETYIEQRLIDLVVHNWDLATAIGADTTMAPQLLDAVYEIVEAQQEQLDASGMFADRVAVTEDAPKQTRLLALLGRAA